MITTGAVARTLQSLPEDRVFTRQVLYNLLVEGLPAQQAQVYQLIEASDVGVTNPDLQVRMRLSGQHAGNVLARLHRLGLVSRVGPPGHYVYRVENGCLQSST